MDCELCEHEAKKLRLCRECAEMIARVAVVDQRMKTHEICAAERLENPEVKAAIA